MLIDNNLLQQSRVCCATLALGRRLLLSARQVPVTAAGSVAAPADPGTTNLSGWRRHMSASPFPSSPPHQFPGVWTPGAAAVEQAPVISAETPHGAFFAPPDGLVNPDISAGIDPALSDLGVGWWWPPDLVQHALEWLHNSAELPWWVSITALVVTTRVLLFPVMVINRRNCNNYMNVAAEQQELMANMMRALKDGRAEEAEWLNKQCQTKIKSEMMPAMMRFMSCPLLVFGPVFGSTFLGLKRLSASGLPSLETGGALWFLDLTVPDPFLGLPIVSIATTYAMLAMGTELPDLSQIPGTKYARFLIYGLPLVALPLAVHFSVAVVYFWSLNNMISMAQGLVLKQPAVAKAFNIPSTRKLSAESGNMMAEFKQALKQRQATELRTQMAEQVRKQQEQRRAKQSKAGS